MKTLQPEIAPAHTESARRGCHEDVDTLEHEIVRLREELSQAKEREVHLEAKVEKAHATIRAKSDFLAHMSHELRSPMTAVIGMSELLLETTLSGEQRDMLSTVRRSAGALVTLVNDILDYSKIESGKMQVEEREFDLRECIEECLDLLAPNVQDKPVQLLYEMNGDTPETIIGDSNRLRQIMVNLVGNAIKFTSEGEILVSTCVEDCKGSRAKVRVSVRDSGIGIPADRIDMLFADYAQVDKSTARKYGGTGLGLSISRGLAELLNGTMWVESVEGEGSTFHFTFSCKVAKQAQPWQPDATEPIAGRRLLLVERNDTSRALLARQLTAWGMEVIAMSDFTAALTELETGQNFDVAVLDRKIRDAGGNDLCSHVRRRAADLPIVLLTSIGSAATQTTASAASGVNLVTYVSRPMKPKRLWQAITKALKHRPTPKPTEDQTPSVPAAVDQRLGEKLNISILLADDEMSIQKVAQKFLSKMGFDAEIVSNGQEVLDALQRRSFDVVLIDFNMPVMGGLEAAARIREEFTAETAPYLVAMTGAVGTDSAEECFAQGIDDVLPKPWGPHDLQKTLEDAASIVHWRRERMLVAS